MILLTSRWNEPSRRTPAKCLLTAASTPTWASPGCEGGVGQRTERCRWLANNPPGRTSGEEIAEDALHYPVPFRRTSAIATAIAWGVSLILDRVSLLRGCDYARASEVQSIGQGRGRADGH